MVSDRHEFCALAQTAVEPADRVGEAKLPPTVSAAALLAIIGILLVGFFLIIMAMLGGKWTRRLMNQRRGAALPADRPPLRKAGDDAEKSAEAQADDKWTQETKGDDPRGGGETRTP